MGSLGTILRREREASGLTLEEIATRTKIGIRLLRAIETEQFDKLPGGLFNKSFVRQYARALGIDEEVAVQEYMQAYGAKREAPAAQRNRPEESFSTETDYGRVVMAVVGVVVLVAGLGYGGYRLVGYVGSRAEPSESREAMAETVPAPDNPAPVLAEELETTAEGYEAESSPEAPSEEPLGYGGENQAIAESEPEGVQEESRSASLGSRIAAGAIAEPASAGMPGAAGNTAEELALRIDSHGTVWLSITADGVRQWQGTMRANQSREVQANESVRLTVGDAGAVSLTLNGKSLPGLGRAGEVRNLTITARDAAVPSP